ncbi:response regulator transcription factor [Brevibacillus sp. B_LB10_24]|uniref:response regulator transcription factor n=1 Tax=Brevibacillus sp. B_LB10_24 TaxID=3380645 RepID=UPI0038BA36A8
MRVLVIEDEKELNDLLALGLRKQKFAVDVSYDGIDGEEKALVNEYDLIILDINLPGKTGLEVCKSIRAHEVNSAVIMLTANDKVSDRINGLDIGADDYVVKPFDFRELLSRMYAVLRRSFNKMSPVIRIGPLEIDPGAHRVTYDGQEIELTSKEFDVLQYMSYRHPEIVSLEDMLEHIWGEQVNPFTNAIRVHLSNVRRKLKKAAGVDIIVNIIGKGYKFQME